MTKKILRVGEVSKIIGLSPSSVHRLTSMGQFPSKVRIGGAVGWLSNEIDQFIEHRANNRKDYQEFRIISSKIPDDFNEKISE